MERLNIDELLDAYDNIMRVTTSGTPLYQRAESVRYYLQQLLHYQKLDASFDHIRDLVEAEQDGLLVVLPCKVGDTVYMPVGKWNTITGYEADECDGFHIARDGVLQIKAKCYSGNHETYGIPGKTVFLTREEADAALAQKGGTHEADSV